MHPTIDITRLTYVEIEKLGPVVLGQAGWKAIMNANGGTVPSKWTKLVELANEEFGLSAA